MWIQVILATLVGTMTFVDCKALDKLDRDINGKYNTKKTANVLSCKDK